jgi:hypothetical protein
MRPIALLLAAIAAMAAFPRTPRRVRVRRFATREGALFHRLTADVRRGR